MTHGQWTQDSWTKNKLKDLKRIKQNK